MDRMEVDAIFLCDLQAKQGKAISESTAMARESVWQERPRGIVRRMSARMW